MYLDPQDRLLAFLSEVAAGGAAGPLHRSMDPNGSVYSYLAMPGHDPPWSVPQRRRRSATLAPS